MRASVVIPAFNAAGSLLRALKSVSAQTLQDIECIVVDDGSTDGTSDLVRRYATEDPRIKLSPSTGNHGVSAARNTGMAQAAGEWIAFLDADDAFTPSRVEQLVALGDAQGVDLVSDDILYFDWSHQEVVGTGVGKPGTGFDRVTASDLLANSITGRSLLDYSLLKPVVRRSLVEQGRYRYIEGLRQGEDFMVLAQALLGGATMVLSHQALYVYTERVGRNSRAASNLSRTIDNCEEMRRQTLSLLEHPAVRAAPDLAKLIHERADAITFFERWERVYQPLRARQPVALLRAIASDWRAALILTGIVGRHLLRRG